MRVVKAAQHINATVTFATDKEARTCLVVVTKATYSIPANGRMPRPYIPPQPVLLADVFSGAPGLSAPLCENDLVPFKPHCDVVFDATAHSPDGEPRTRLDVRVRVGTMAKSVRVIGDRHWEKDLLILRSGRPTPFTTMPLHYGRAFGGTHVIQNGEKSRHDAFADNPFGRGYAADAEVNVHGLLLPNLEAPDAPIRIPQRGVAVALSPLPRTAPERFRHAGTFDQHWKDTLAPFWPPDFDERFFQCAPEDQRIAFPLGGEEVVLENMMPGRPQVHFRLPRLDVVPVRVLHRDYKVSESMPNADTLFFEPDKGRFSVVWRSHVPLGPRGAREVNLVVIGQVCQRWWDGVRRGGAGCQGCGAVGMPDREPSWITDDTAASSSAPSSPDLCVDCPENPAVDPFAVMPPIVVNQDDAQEEPEEAARKKSTDAKGREAKAAEKMQKPDMAEQEDRS